jgi:transposase
MFDSAWGTKMGRPYSQDLRDRVMSAVDGGASPAEVAELFEVDVSYIYKALIRRRTTGIITALPWAAGPRPKLEAYEDALRRRVAELSDATLEEIRAWLISEHGVKVSIGCLWATLKRLKLSLKKSHSMPPSKTAKTSPASGVPGMRLKAS